MPEIKSEIDMTSTIFERECEHKIRNLVKNLAIKGLIVRREKLTRGPSFKVKSGRCALSGKEIVFLDRRLPVDIQLQVLEDHLGTN